MANNKSAEKRAGQAERRRLQNRSARSVIATTKRVFLAAVQSKDKSNTLEKFKALCSILDKSAKQGVIKMNTADRGKARASAMIAKMG